MNGWKEVKPGHDAFDDEFLTYELRVGSWCMQICTLLESDSDWVLCAPFAGQDDWEVGLKATTVEAAQREAVQWLRDRAHVINEFLKNIEGAL